MDLLTFNNPRLICAALTALIFFLILAQPRSPRFRVIVLGLIIALGIANGFQWFAKRTIHSNLTHYYLGAKYPHVGHFDFYKVMTSAMGRPQMMYRNLHTPDTMFRSDPREQRLYYLRLLQQESVAHPEHATLQQLADLCQSNGLVDKEAAAILNQTLTPAQEDTLRQDLTQLKLDVDDFGFNGSPLYTLIRQMDPSLHQRFGPTVCLINMVWQWIAVFLLAFLAQQILQWTREETLLVIALLLASWDFTGWALNGLVMAGWILPVMVSLWGFSRHRPWLAGFCIAWAGLIKLFPFALILPPAVILARQILARHITTLGKEAAKTLGACAVSTVALMTTSSLTGQSWTEFFQKIIIQFQHSNYLNNSAGISAIFLTLGLSRSLSIILPQATVFFALLWILWMRDETTFSDRLPTVSLILLASMAWLTRTWFNYYAVIVFFLFPGILRTHRHAAYFLLALFILGGFLPEFGFAYTKPFFFLPIIKILGYLILPLVAIAIEFENIRSVEGPWPARDVLSRWFYRQGPRIVCLGTIASVSFICAEIYLANSAYMNLLAGRNLYSQGAVRESKQFFEDVVQQAPRNAAVRLELARVLTDLQDMDGALAQYQKSIELAPDYAPARSHLGVLFIQLGNKNEAVAQFQEAVRLMPWDETFQLNLGLALLSMGKTNEAAAHLRTALDIDPEFSPARKQLQRIGLP